MQLPSDQLAPTLIITLDFSASLMQLAAMTRHTVSCVIQGAFTGMGSKNATTCFVCTCTGPGMHECAAERLHMAACTMHCKPTAGHGAGINVPCAPLVKLHT